MRTLSPEILKLLDGTSPELLTAPEDFTNGAWVANTAGPSDGTVTRTPGAIGGPDDATTGTKLAAAANYGSIVFTQHAVVDGPTAVYEIIVKQGSGATIANRFALYDGTDATTLVEVDINYATGAIAIGAVGPHEASVRALENGWWLLRLEALGLTPGHTITGYVGWTGQSAVAGDYLFVRRASLRARYDPPNVFAGERDFSNAAWVAGTASPGAGSVTRTSAFATGPDGTVNAWKLAAVAAYGSIVFTQSQIVRGSAMVYQAVVKKGTGATTANRFHLRDSTAARDLVGVELNFDSGAFTYIAQQPGTYAIVAPISSDGWWLVSLYAHDTISGHVFTGYLGWVSQPSAAGDYLLATKAILRPLGALGFNAFARAWVANADGTYKNLNDLAGAFLMSVDADFDLDRPLATISLTALRAGSPAITPNLLEAPDNPTAAAWDRSNVDIASGLSAPDGSATAWQFTVHANGSASISQDKVIRATRARAVIELRDVSGGGAFVGIGIQDVTGSANVLIIEPTFNFTTGEFTLSSSNGTVTVEKIGDIWWRLTFDATGLVPGRTYRLRIGWDSSASAGQAFGFNRAEFRAVYGSTRQLSLAPLKEDSLLNVRDDGTTYAPLLDPGRSCYVEYQIVPLGADPIDGDWLELWRGFLDRVEDNDDGTITATGRDLAAPLVDAWFVNKVSYQYADADAQPLETVIQWLLDQISSRGVDAPEPVTLYAPESSTYLVRSVGYDIQSAWERLTYYAQLRGWDLRYKWNEDDGAWRLTLADPVREKTTPDVIFAPDHYISIKGLAIDRTQVRNDFTVYYGPSNVPVIGRRSVHRQNLESSSRFGLRPLVDQEDETSPVDSDIEANTLIDYMESDTAFPKAEVTIERLFAPHLEINDLIGVLANGVHSSVDQNFAATRIHHHLDATSCRSSIDGRGKPASHYTGWFARAAKQPAKTFGTPHPIIGTITHEATARDGNGEARVHVPITFERSTDQIRIYISEAASSPELPARTAEYESAMSPVIRREGDTASAKDWATDVDIATTPGFQRRLLMVPINPNGIEGPVIDTTITPADSGTPPSAPPSSFTVTPSVVGGIPQNALAWTNGDSSAQTRVWRNGYMLTRIAAGTASFTDIGIDPSKKYDYYIEHLRNGQTSERATASVTAGSVKLATPTWIDPTPSSGGFDSLGNALIQLRWFNPDPLASTKVYMNNQTTDGGAFSVIYTAPPGVSSFTVNEADHGGGLSGVDRWFTLTATRDGYTESDTAIDESATFGSAA